MKFWADYGAYLPVRRIYAMLFDKVMAHNFELAAMVTDDTTKTKRTEKTSRQ